MKKKLLQFGGILLILISLMGNGVRMAYAQAATTNVSTVGNSGATSNSATVAASVANKQVDSAGHDDKNKLSLWASLFGYPNLSDFVDHLVAMLANWAITAMGFVLALAGYLLNFSINLTLHIKDFVDSTPAIFSTWKALRDISGILVMFMLVWAALKIILDIGGGFGKTLKDIVIVGLLINFSFFFAGVMIDLSNIVSVQLYNAIAPANSLNTTAATTNIFQNEGVVSFKSIDGGISDIFMSALKVQTIYKNGVSGNAGGSNSSGPTPPPTYIIILSSIVAVGIEFIAAMSFLAAAFAFVFRFVILITLLAFSPIWIASRVIPETKKYADEWWNTFTSMLVFMPAYLLLMYLAMNVITTSKLFGTLNGGGVVGNGAWYANILILGINAFIIIFMINLPLVVAIKLGGSSTKYANALSKKVSGFIGTRTVGWAASKIDKDLATMRLPGGFKPGNTVLGRDIRGATVGALAKNKMGASRSYDELQKAYKESTKAGKDIEKKHDLEVALKRAETAKPTEQAKAFENLNDAIKKVGGKEKIGLIGAALSSKNDDRAKALFKLAKKEDFDEIKKNEDISDDDKLRVEGLRKDALKEAVKQASETKAAADAKNADEQAKAASDRATKVVKGMIGGLSGGDILKLVDAKDLTSPSVVEQLKPKQLKEMADEGMEADTQVAIGNMIANWQVLNKKAHPARSFVTKKENAEEWLSDLNAQQTEKKKDEKKDDSKQTPPNPTIFDAYRKPIF